MQDDQRPGRPSTGRRTRYVLITVALVAVASISAMWWQQGRVQVDLDDYVDRILVVLRERNHGIMEFQRLTLENAADYRELVTAQKGVIDQLGAIQPKTQTVRALHSGLMMLEKSRLGVYTQYASGESSRLRGHMAEKSESWRVELAIACNRHDVHPQYLHRELLY